MFEKFTDRARKVLALANEEAGRFQHEYIGTEHILLGLVKEGTGVGANVLKHLNVDLRQIRLEVEKLIRKGPAEDATARLPHTPRAKKVIEYAIEEARMLRHNYVGTEHLLLGLVREEDSVAGQVLMNLGLNLESVRREVKGLLGVGTDTEDEPSDSSITRYERASAFAERFKDHPLVKHYRALIDALVQRKDEYVKNGDYEKAAELRDQAEGVAVQLQHLCRLLEEDPNFGR
jgi:ATP-dependent Clp protease ATP-binding subunit ClpA